MCEESKIQRKCEFDTREGSRKEEEREGGRKKQRGGKGEILKVQRGTDVYPSKNRV